MGKNRRRNLTPVSTSNLWPVFAIETDRGWRVTRNIGFAEAEGKVERGEFVRVYDQQAQVCVGYKPSSAGPSNASDVDIPSRASSSSITMRETQAVAGERGRSRTSGMAEDLKLSRRHPKSGRLLAPEDAVELAIEKVRAWPRVGDPKATRVSPVDRSARA